MRTKLQAAEFTRDEALERARLIEQRYKRSQLREETARTVEIEESLLREAVSLPPSYGGGAASIARRWVKPYLREGRRLG